MKHQISPFRIPEEIRQIAQRAFPKGNVYMTMRDEVGMIYQDGQFTHLFSHAGRPGEAPGFLALVMVMQYMEGLSDEQAAEQVRARIDWKYMLGLTIDDPGFHHDVLRRFRERLVAGGEEEALLNHMLTHFEGKGWVQAGGTQRTDSTHVLAAVRNLNRLELVGEALRCVLEQLATIVPNWLSEQITPDWLERYGARFEAYRLPKKKKEQAALAAQIGSDGVYLLQCLHAPDAPHRLETLPAVETMRRIWIQQYQQEAGQVRWRQQADLPPATLLIESPYDVEAHYSYKRDTEWVGYKVHYTETCPDDQQPSIITQVTTTTATVPDHAALPHIQQDLVHKTLSPDNHLVDQGYVDANNLATSLFSHEVDLIGPAPKDTSWQAKADKGFAKSCFVIDWDAQLITCPAGKTSHGWYPHQDEYGKDVIQVRFLPDDCRSCPQRALCTKAQTAPRTIKLKPKEEHVALQRARDRQKTETFQKVYKKRAGIEGTFSQACRSFNLRRSRFRGLDKTHLHHVLIAVAVSLTRTIHWLCGKPRAKTRVSALLALGFS
jgi:transposase